MDFLDSLKTKANELGHSKAFLISCVAVVVLAVVGIVIGLPSNGPAVVNDDEEVVLDSLPEDVSDADVRRTASRIRRDDASARDDASTRDDDRKAASDDRVVVADDDADEAELRKAKPRDVAAADDAADKPVATSDEEQLVPSGIHYEPIKVGDAKTIYTKVYDVVEQMPSFPGGDAALMQYLGSHVKYPAEAEENGITGRVVVSFVVERDGSISTAKVVKSVDPQLDREALRVILSMPKWKPGKQNGDPVRVKYTLPINFRLN